VSATRVARALLLGALAVLALALLLAPGPWEIPGGPGFFASEHDPLHLVVRRALWWSGALAAGLVAALLATFRLWTAPVAAREPAPARTPRWLVPLLLAAALLGAGVRWQLATGGLWWDEAWLVRRIVVGEFRPEPTPGGPERAFVAVPWIRTLFEYEKPTNHLPQSAASRLANDLWRAARGAEPSAFDELVLRLPPFVACLATIVLLGLLAAEWGFPRAGAAAAFVLALQPWHIELATGARGFAFVALAATLGALSLCRALRSGAWPWWLAYAASQVLLVWTHPFAIYLTACLGAAALLRLALGARWSEAARLAAANVLAAAALLLVLGPAIAQVPLWHDSHRSAADDARKTRRLAVEMGREVWSGASIGLSRDVPQTDPERQYPSLASLRREEPWLQPATWRVLPVLAALGLLAVLRRRGPERAVVAGLAAAPFVALAASAALGHLGQRFHPRYLFFVLALVPPLAAIGLDALAARLGGARRGPRAAAVALVAGVLLFAWLDRAALANLATHPYSGMREAAAFVAARPDAAQAFRVGFGLGGDTARVYDPGLFHAESGAELRALCGAARAEGRPLYLLLGYSGQNRHHRGEAFRWIDDPRLFEPLGRFEAVAPEFVYRVLRYTGEPFESS
jgi:hypothetical protein